MQGQRLATVGSVMVALLVVVAGSAQWLAPYDPLRAVADSFGNPLPPCGAHWLGTDELGRDILSRLIYGAQTSLLVASLATLLAVTIGVSIGLVAGYAGGWVDATLMRLTDIMLAFPSLLLVVALSALTQPGLTSIFVVIGLVSWTSLARTVRAETRSVRGRDYVSAAVALGAGPARVVSRHVLPNILPTILTMAALGTSGAILLDAGLSYLGLGIPVPHPSWGRMIADSRTYYRIAPWLMVFPGVSIVFAVLAFNFLGYGLLRALGPPSTQPAGQGSA